MSAAGCRAEPGLPRLDRRPHVLPNPDVPRHRHRAVLRGAPHTPCGPTADRLVALLRLCADTLQVEGEAELLLPAGIALKITGVLPKDASGLTIITCEDDTDAPALIS